MVWDGNYHYMVSVLGTVVGCQCHVHAKYPQKTGLWSETTSQHTSVDGPTVSAHQQGGAT